MNTGYLRETQTIEIFDYSWGRLFLNEEIGGTEMMHIKNNRNKLLNFIAVKNWVESPVLVWHPSYNELIEMVNLFLSFLYLKT